jgi:transcriptional regulator with GAF, ATPase, and Fis domain
VDQEIEQGLRLIVQTLDVDRASLMEFSEDGSELTFTHQWARESIRHDVRRDVRKLVSQQTPWYMDKLLQGETLAYSRLPEALPEEAVAEKAYCAAVGLRSNLTIPLKRSGRPIAALAVACFRRERHWPADLIPRLRLLGEVFLNAVARRNQAVALESALAEIRGLKAQLEEENLYLRKEIDVATRAGGGIVGEGAAIKNALVQAEQVAPTDATVLLLGETGTGKELMARTIHALSTRQGRTMVRLNCAALPPTLIESELFGRERGAYTGALAKQMGRFELADGSTIFLDEIGELPLELRSSCCTSWSAASSSGWGAPGRSGSTSG